MSAVINTNIASLTAQRNLKSSANAMQVSLQRLSSGLRINSAKDDAAGLAITQRMDAQLRGFQVASRNANDGVSLAQTAEGALSEIASNLQRIRELATQASNGSNSQSDRDALDAEVTQLKDEIQRVASQTKFNGVSLLDGSFSGVAFQVGANAGESINVASIANAQTAVLGGTLTRFSDTIAASSLTGFATAIAAGEVTINGVDIGAISSAGNSTERAGQLVEAINRVSSQTNVGASYDGTTGQITLTSNAAVTVAGATNDATVAGWANGAVGASTSTTGIAALTVSSYTNAQQTMSQIDNALKSVNTARASLGAYQNRFMSAIANIANTIENLSAAKSRILDADFAVETAQLTRGQILQQAGTAILAQANALPNNVLSLLR